jgi:hypothetical protein
MGNEYGIDFNVFPNQSSAVGTRVDVVKVTTDGAETITGTVVRDDVVDPFVDIVELEDGSVVLDDERTGYIPAIQGDYKDRRAEVCFNMDASHILDGTIVRDDAREPWKIVIKLDVGRFVLSRECQYRPLPRQE